MTGISRRNLLQVISLETGYVMLSGGLYNLKSHSAPKALLIGIAGLRADSLQAVNTHSIDYLINHGAYSFEAQAGEHTWSGPGWSTILTGVGEAKHGVTDNSGDTFKNSQLDVYPSVFTHLATEKPSLKTASVVSWPELDNYIIKDGWLKEYLPYGQDEDIPVAGRAWEILSKQPVDFLFAYFMSVDMAGHNHGFSHEVPEHVDAIKKVDKYVGQFLRAIQRRPDYGKENWLIMLISDHGGLGKTHGGTSPEEKTIPFVVYGRNVVKGKITPAPSQVDAVPTLLHHLIVPVKSEWGLDGKVVGLK